jgi:hypothetical protein
VQTALADSLDIGACVCVSTCVCVCAELLSLILLI